MEALAILPLMIVGALLALQAAANVQLSRSMGSPFGASTLQLGIGAGILLLATTAVGGWSAFARLGTAEPWTLVGGVGSAVYITAGILLFPRLGAVVAVGLFIAGQMLASLSLDAFGWLGVTQDVPGAGALLGALAVMVGAWLIVRAQADAGALESAVRGRAGWIVLALLAGGVLPIQGAINAQLAATVGVPVVVAAFSFVVATLAMALFLIVTLLAGGPRPRLGPLRSLPWWGWLGGLCGATYVTAVFVAIPHIGAAPVVALTIAGQQLAAVGVDRFGLLRLPQRTITRRRLAGVVVLLLGVVLTSIG